MANTCAVANCRNTDINFYSLPSMEDRRYKRWLYLIGRPDLLTCKGDYHICEVHFRHSDFEQQSSSSKLLVPDAEPSLHLPDPGPKLQKDLLMFLTVNKDVQCNLDKKQRFHPSMSQTDLRAEKKKLSKRVKHKIVFDQLCDKFFPKNIAYVIKSHVDVKDILNNKKHMTSYKYRACVFLYQASPASYIALQKSLKLPSIKDLIYYSRGSIAKGLTILMKTMKPKIASLSDLEKNCTVLISIVELKPHLYYHIREDKIYGFCKSIVKQQSEVARYALTCMVRGIYEQWTLPVDYALFYTKDDRLNSSMSKWINLTILKLIKAGFKVRACISNLRSSEIVAKQQPVVTTETPFFFVNNVTRLFYVYDPNYLMISVYKYLQNHEFHYGNSVAKWQDVVEFYKNDSKKAHRLAPELTENHILPTNDKTIEARVAIETLSERVAAGISTYVDFGQMDACAKGTVHLLTIMSRFYKFMNSAKSSNSCEHQETFNRNKIQADFITEAMMYLKNLKVTKDGVDVTPEVKFLKQLQISIKAIKMLLKDLNVPYLCTNNIRFNVMSNFLNQIVEKSKTKDITAWRLICAYRKMVFKNMLKPFNKKFCSELIHMMHHNYNLNSSANKKEPSECTNFKLSNISLPVKISDYKDFKLPAQYQLIPICEFLLRKCLERHSLCSLPKIKKANASYSRYNTLYGAYQSSPVTSVPDDNFVNFVEALDKELQERFMRYVSTQSLFVLEEYSANPLESSFIPPCPCFPVKFMIKLFFRLRISQQLRMNNMGFRESSSKKLNLIYYDLS